MKKAHLLLLSLLFTSLLKAQSTTGSTYFFNGNLNENLGGPVLQTLACNAATGTFGTETITTATGTCGTTPANTFRFNDGGGFTILIK